MGREGGGRPAAQGRSYDPIVRIPALVVSVLLAASPCLGQDPTAGRDGVQLRFSVDLQDGVLRVDELVRALLAAYELDASDLALPTTRVDLEGPAGALLLFGGHRLLLETVRFRRDLEAQQLVVTIDRERSREVRRVLRARIARFAARLAGTDVEERRYDLVLPGDLDPARPLVVLVHGIESTPESLSDLHRYLVAPPRACQVATFAFPNDEAVDRVAAEFARRLRALAGQPVAIVGHSMGGLVGRAVVEDAALDPGNVRTLVLLGTPNAGSNLAGLRFALEARSVLGDAADTRDFARELLDACLDHWRDGLGEAGGDLLPESVFLQRLGARQRNPKVDYHVVIGTRSLLQPEQLEAVRREVRERLGANAATRFVRPRLERWLLDLDELVDGQGDGAVSVRSGRLPGTDPVLVPVDHMGLVRLRGLTGDRKEPGDHPVFGRVAAWVEPGR